MPTESPTSVRARQACGVISIAALPLAMVASVSGSETFFTLSVLTFFALPWGAMILPLNLSSALDRSGKTVWRQELMKGRMTSYIAVWAYLFTNDLSAREAIWAVWQD